MDLDTNLNFLVFMVLGTNLSLFYSAIKDLGSQLELLNFVDLSTNLNL